MQGDIEEDESVPDRDEDIRPRFPRLRLHTMKHATDNGSEGSITEHDEEQDCCADDDSSLSDWNLSKF